MSVESATYISDLVSSNPAATDLRGQGDDHLRLIKAAVKATFPNATKPFYLPSGTSLQTSTVNVAATDDNKLIPVNSQSGGITVNLPQGSTLVDGFTVKIVKADHSFNFVTIDGYSTETINDALTLTLHQRYQVATLQWVASLSAWVAEVMPVVPIGSVVGSVVSAAQPGWLVMDGTTIGNASSGATQRANADCLGLFQYLWHNLGNTYAPVSGGRGASGLIDFNANKTITIPSMAGRTFVGMDPTGSVLGSIITGSINGNYGGTETVTLTSAESGQKAISSAPVAISDPGHTHLPSGANVGGNGTAFDAQLSGSTGRLTSLATFILTTVVTGITATFSLAGSNAAAGHSNMQPSRLGTWMIKL